MLALRGCLPFIRALAKTHILRLRQKLESDPLHPSHLLTVHGLGYKFVPQSIVPH
ncbi:MAG: helix-turn-helix domain-containing protein [Terriglobales bacterium]